MLIVAWDVFLLIELDLPTSKTTTVCKLDNAM